MEGETMQELSSGSHLKPQRSFWPRLEQGNVLMSFETAREKFLRLKLVLQKVKLHNKR
jgi:hypothetical protein